MNAQTTQVDDLRLTALPSALSCANLFVRFTLTEWSLRPLLDEAAEVARRLVSAVVDSANPKSPSFLTLRLRLHGDYLVIEVEDDQVVNSPIAAPPLPGGRRADAVSFNGRGKLVWCELPLPTGMTAAAVPLPHREPGRSPEPEQAPPPDIPIGADSQILQRILYGLNQSANGRPS